MYNELKLFIGIELMKYYLELSPDEIQSLNFLESVIISGMINEMWFNIMLLSDSDTELIIRSSEYARIHKWRL